MGLCSHDSCRRHSAYNVLGSKTAIYCKHHASDGMVNVRSKRCLHESCARRPSFNLVDSKTAVYCKHHASDGMVNVRHKRCLHLSLIHI